MKNSILIISIIGLLTMGGCKKYEDPGFPDSPTVEEALQDPTLNDLILLSRGVEAQAKVDIDLYVDLLGALGRETFDLNEIDPRYTGELLGAEGGPLDPGGFLTSRSYTARYKNVRMMNNILLGLENSTFNFTSEQENGFKGFVNTMMANALQMNLNMQYENGIRVDVSDIDNLGPFLSRSESQLAIMNLLNEAYTQLQNAGDEMPYELGSGMADLNTPQGFAQFNRALAAKSALYMGNKSLALDLLGQSFFGLANDLNMGAYLTYNVSDGINNPLNHTDKYMAHPTFLSDAEANDSRVTSKTMLSEPVTADGLTGEYVANIYPSPGDNVSIIRNEELVLLYAEANIGANNAEAIAALNVVRGAASLGDYSGGNSDSEVMDELIKQRRYSLFGEGHRWIDMRRWDMLDELPTDRDGDVVHVQFPRPFGE